jgi:ribosome production factor 2
MALKRPNAISFSKKNTVRPFEDASSLEFWAQKNDASLFVVGQSTKKRPDGLVFARTFDGHVLDMCEVGVEEFVGMDKFKVCVGLSFVCYFSANELISLLRHRNRRQGINR